MSFSGITNAQNNKKTEGLPTIAKFYLQSDFLLFLRGWRAVFATRCRHVVLPRTFLTDPLWFGLIVRLNDP